MAAEAQLIRISWLAPEGFRTGYRVIVTKVNSGVEVTNSPHQSTNYQLDGLESETAYEFRVATESGSRQSGFVNATFTTSEKKSLNTEKIVP